LTAQCSRRSPNRRSRVRLIPIEKYQFEVLCPKRKRDTFFP
jgi:hypothetical protein